MICEKSLEQYILSAPSPELSNGMVRQLSGHATAWDSAPDFNKLHDMALASLDHFSAVGLLEEFALSMELFYDRLGWKKRSFIMQENSSRKSMGDDSYEQYRELVYAHNEKDLMLYRHIRERFKRDTEKITKNFSQPVPKPAEMLFVNIHRMLEWFQYDAFK